MSSYGHAERCPMPAEGGGDCWEPPYPSSRHGLCVRHWREIVEDWVDDPAVSANACAECGATNIFEPIYWASARCGRCGAHMSHPEVILDAERRKEVARLAEAAKRERRPSVVYYIRLSDRIKIGFTTNLPGRMLVLPHDEVLAIEPGDFQLEQARHKQFREFRVVKQREWFHAVPPLLAHIEALRAEHGIPKQKWARRDAPETTDARV